MCTFIKIDYLLYPLTIILSTIKFSMNIPIVYEITQHISLIYTGSIFNIHTENN